MTEDNERWECIPDFPLYEVSTHGRIRRSFTGHIMKPRICKDGYRNVKLSPGRKNRRIARLVAQTFIPNPEQKPQVNHIDAVRDNDRVSNLEWATASENVRHSWALGNNTAEKLTRARGQLTADQVRALRDCEGKRHQVKRLAEKFGISPKHASAIRSGQHHAWVAPIIDKR